MFIRSIKIEGFKDKNRVIDLKFSDTPITILYGDNGCGKTTLLRVLSALFSRDEEVLKAENIQSVEIELEDKNEIKIYETKRAPVEKINLEMMDLEAMGSEPVFVREEYEWVDFPCEVRTLLFGVNRGVSHNIAVQPIQIERFFHSSIGTRYLKGTPRHIESLAEDLVRFLRRDELRSRHIDRLRVGTRRRAELNKKNSICDELDMGTIENLIWERYELAERKKKERVQNALFSTLSKAIYSSEDNYEVEYEPERFRKQLEYNRAKLLTAIEDTGENELQRKLISILDNEDVDEIINECDKNVLLKTLLINMITELEKDEEILESISKILLIFNEHIASNKKLCVDEKGVRIEFVDSEESHNLASLSSGEKHLLSFLTVCILNAQTKDIVMIDEPELSLNGKWKRTILDELQKLLPNTQIIVATHSTTIVDGKFNALAKLI